MAGLRNTFLRTFSGVARLFPFPWLMRLAGQDVIIPLYHVVSDASLAHIRHLYPVKSVTDFQADLDFLLKYLQPIDLMALRDHVSGTRPLQKPALLLTFDDGLREFHDVVAPVLKAKGVPAVCFLNSGFLDNQGLFFRYKASLLIEEMGQGQHAQALDRCLQAAGIHDAAGPSGLLKLKYEQTDLLDELAGEIGFDFGDWLQKQQPYLTSAQVRDLASQGFQFGGHSIDHPEYQYLDLAEQLRQSRVSMDLVQEKFDLDYRTFAFPFTDFGVSSAFFQELYADASPPDLTFGCAGLKKEALPRHLQRIPLEMQSMSAKSILPAEFLYYLAKAPLGKNKMKRP